MTPNISQVQTILNNFLSQFFPSDVMALNTYDKHNNTCIEFWGKQIPPHSSIKNKNITKVYVISFGNESCFWEFLIKWGGQFILDLKIKLKLIMIYYLKGLAFLSFIPSKHCIRIFFYSIFIPPFDQTKNHKS